MADWRRCNGRGGSTTARGMRCYVRSAALGGHLEVLVWARENGCPWDKGTYEGAAMEGQLEAWAYTRALFSST